MNALALSVLPRPMRLLQRYDDGEDARHFTFQLEDIRAEDAGMMPGQFFMLVLPGCGEAPFTYVSRPDDQGRFSALIRRMGKLTEALFELQPGEVLGYRGPFGQGWPRFYGKQRILAVAGGCGLAPLAGFIEDVARTRSGTHLQVIYGARHVGARVLSRERARWSGALPLIETLDQAGPGHRQGTPLAHFDTVFGQAPPDAVLCCGPEVLMEAAARECLGRGLRADQIWLSVERRMHCGVGLCGHCYVGDSYACRDGPTYRYDRYRELLRRSGCARELDRGELRHC
ncbi:MAG: FAD/NAD(P)-binding protein [Gammaproteobacteria bacterium]|nr:FAD/NAD(P)-binding protein [Gammaproteobacteria bacterium]